MLLAYLDESYTRDRYYIAAVLVPDTRAVSLTRALDQVVAEAATGGAVPTGAELHGRDLYQGKGDWAGWWKSVRARIHVYQGALQAIADHGVTVIVEGAEIATLEDPARPHSLVLMLLLERIDRYAVDHHEFVLVIADELPEQDGHRRELREYQALRPWGDRIVDTLHFAPSSASRLVQAVDLVVFLYRRLDTDQDTSDRARQANLALWALIEPCLVVHRGALV